MYPRPLHHLGGSQIVFFVKTGLKFYKNSYFFTILRSSNQRIDNNRVFRHPILGNHDLLTGRVMNGLIQEMDEMFKRMIREMQHQILLAHITEYGFFLIQTIQCHGTRFQLGTKFLTGIRQMSQILQVQVFVSRNQIITIDAKCIDQKLQIIRRHLSVIHKTAYSTYFTLFHLFTQLFHHNFGTGCIIHENIGVTRYLATITAIQIIARKHTVDIRLYNIFHIHQVKVFSLSGKFYETGNFAIRQFDNIVFLFPRVFARHAYRQIQTVVT